GLERGFGGEELRHVCSCSDIFRVVVTDGSARGTVHHLLCGLDVCMRLRKRMLDGLIRTDRPSEHLAFPCVLDTGVDGCLTQPHTFRGNDETLFVQPIEHLVESCAFLADDCRLRKT